MKNETLKKIAIDIHAGKIFSDRDIGDNPGDICMVFMPIVFMKKDEFEKLNAYFIYEYIEAAGPRSINGMPQFFSFQFLNKEQFEKMLTYLKKIEKAIDGVE